MTKLRRVRANWTEIDNSARQWSQGHMLFVPYAAWAYVPELPSTSESLRKVRDDIGKNVDFDAPDDDFLVLEGHLPAVIVTQSCDLAERVQNEPFFMVALVNRLPEPDERGIDDKEREARERSWRRAVAGANTGRFAISVLTNGKWAHEVLGPGRWFVDLRSFYPIEKGKLLQVTRSGVVPAVGVPDPLRKRFALHLQERMGRDEIPDSVERGFFAPLVQRLRHLRIYGTEQEQAVLNGMVREIRYIVEPADATNYLIQVFVCLSEDCADGSSEREAAARLFAGLIDEFASLAIDARLRPLRIVGPDLLDIDAKEYRDSHRLNWSVAA